MDVIINYNSFNVLGVYKFVYGRLEPYKSMIVIKNLYTKEYLKHEAGKAYWEKIGEKAFDKSSLWGIKSNDNRLYIQTCDNNFITYSEPVFKLVEKLDENCIYISDC